ncbi:MAG: DUF983 domain-containing protein [Rhodobacteraceae bacterium]|jgi:uncharacterized protein (DUF983 family)|nr:DUF983 domain-containing protein [Paracoccaceae bacterium]
MTDTTYDQETDRPMRRSILRGLACRCPHCGKGRLLHSYLKVNDHCPECGEEFFHHRADDGPAYMTILIVGHLLAPLILWFFVAYRPEPMTMIAIFMTGSIALSAVLLPRMKGMIVAIQWAQRMHGFAHAGASRRND